MMPLEPMRDRKRRPGPWVLLAAALMLLAFFLVYGCGGEAADETADAAGSRDDTRTALVRTALPEQRDVVDTVSLSADLEAERRAVLSAEVAGTVEAVTVEQGDRVARGQTVARVDTRALAQRLAEADAVARQAGAQFERAQALYERRSITKAQMLDAVTNRDVAQARLASARLDLSKSRLTAPWSGQVAATMVEVGDYVVPGQPVVELVEVDRLKVVAPASSGDVPYLEVGRPVKIRVDALPGEVFEGTITRLGAELDPSSRTLDVEAELANPDGRLRPGMLATLEVPRQTLAGALLVPLEAVVDLGEERALFVNEDGVARRRIVELGPVLGDRVVVSSGVGPGDRVIVEGETRVADGQPVEEVAVENAAVETED